jgi:hypothetical protein
VLRNLQDEIAAFRIVVDYFESHRDRYPLEQFDLRGLLGNLISAIERDVTTSIEHRNLDAAVQSFAHHQGAHVPRRYPELSTENVLAMEFIRGDKITTAPQDPAERRQLARKLLRYTVWHALFHDGFFHADPHAGNVFYEPAGNGRKKSQIAFLDWSLAARLSREERESMVKLIVAIERGKLKRVMSALQAMAESDLEKDIDGEALRNDVRWILADYLGRKKLAPPGPKPEGAGMRPEDVEAARKRRGRGDGPCEPPITAVDYVLDRALARGVAFNQEVLLFKKAMITVDAVLCDLYPEVTRQKYLGRRLGWRMVIELPKRIVLLPWPDKRSYKSMVSNREFFGLIGTKIADVFR